MNDTGDPSFGESLTALLLPVKKPFTSLISSLISSLMSFFSPSCALVLNVARFSLARPGLTNLG